MDDKAFFAGKRPWSRLKDRILAAYLPAYLTKVAKRNRRIVLVDAFAGAGKFDDGTAGSPLIICNAAEKYAKGKYHAVFMNTDEASHAHLTHLLQTWIQAGTAVALHGSATAQLADVGAQLGSDTAFIYLDPFGIKGCEFSTIAPLLKRDSRHSTEILISLDASIIHRLAARRAVNEGRGGEPRIKTFHNTLTDVLGGDDWRASMLDPHATADEQIMGVMRAYQRRIEALGMTYTGSCPIRQGAGGKILRTVTFCSRHPHALELMNENMHRAYAEAMADSESQPAMPGFAEWESESRRQRLRAVILATVRRRPGRSRRDVWQDVAQQHFMEYTHSDHIAVVSGLVRDGVVHAEDVRGTGRLNDDSRLSLL